MIIERPGASNDRETYIGNLDQEVDKKKFDENYDKIDWNSDKSLQEDATKVDNKA